MTKLISIILTITLVPTLSISYSPLSSEERVSLQSPLPLWERIKVRGNIGTSIVFAFDLSAVAQAGKITPYPPETKQTPAIEEIKEEKKGISWLWVLLGVAVAGGIVAVVGGSKSDNTSNSSSSGGGSTGTTTVTW